jgi:hypothetical protein
MMRSSNQTGRHVTIGGEHEGNMSLPVRGICEMKAFKRGTGILPVKKRRFHVT